jgi:hypothetical protein
MSNPLNLLSSQPQRSWEHLHSNPANACHKCEWKLVFTSEITTAIKAILNIQNLLKTPLQACNKLAEK